ncbi:glutathione peroxidase [Haloferula chungangensis]|uniref:Glutathione peroxidase n=1 Tax=Haloferula chungangensis TaxID=1048331 RepID=A0ABW2L7Z1_9BACT
MKLLCTLLAATTLMSPASDLSEIPFKTIKDKETSLADYKGKVVLIVNTASKCGLTPQYEGLENLYQKYQGKDFVILGFPCNDFKGQEPGTAEEIEKFCKTKYDVSFPLMAKIHVLGEDQHPLYTALTGPEGAFPGDVKWNFGKFLIGKDGKPIARFEPRQTPQSKEVVDAIEKAL